MQNQAQFIRTTKCPKRAKRYFFDFSARTQPLNRSKIKNEDRAFRTKLCQQSVSDNFLGKYVKRNTNLGPIWPSDGRAKGATC